MRIRLFAPALLVLAGAHAASAQQSRVTLSVTAGRQWNSALFDHAAAFTTGGYQVSMAERLRVPEATRAGARVSVRVAGPWLVYADVAHASTHLRYRDDQMVIDPQGLIASSHAETRKPARVTSWGGGVGRTLDLPRRLPELALTLGGAVQRYSLDREQFICTAPSGGFSCPPSDPWETRYTVPSVSGGLTLRQALTPRFGVELRSAYTIGRIETTGMRDDLVPELDAYEAPKHQTVRTGDVSLGLWVRP